MRTRIVAGLSLVAGMVVSSIQAQEVQWRASAPRSETSTPASSPKAPRPIAMSVPVPLETAAPVMRDPAVTPVSFRAVSPARASADEVRYPTRLPSSSSPVLASQDSDKPEQIPVPPAAVPGASQETIVPYVGEAHHAPDGTPSSESCACGGACDDCCCDCCCCETCGCCRCWPLGCGLGGGPLLGAFSFDGCASRQYFWFSAEYLLWNISRDHVVPLLTTAPPGTPQSANPGALDQPDTSVVYGSDQLANPTRSGGRFTFGFWLPKLECWGAEVSYFFLGQRDSNFFIRSDGDPILARPFVDASVGKLTSGLPVANLLAFPGVTRGAFIANSTSFLWGIEGNARRKLMCCPGGWVDGLVGYRHLRFNESLDVFDVEISNAGDVLAPQDRFATRNNFDGGQIGIEGQYNLWRRWSVGGFCKVALGNVHQVLSISGFMPNTGPPPGGFLALASNTTGSPFKNDRFGVLPEVGLKVGWNPTEHLQFFVGYDFLYLSSVIRVGEQVDGEINPDLFPGTGNPPNTPRQRPAVLFKTNDFWAHGVNIGAIYYW